MKTFVQITLATILATTSMMTLAETTNGAHSQAEATTVKHESMTVTLNDKHFAATAATVNAISTTQTATQASNNKTKSAQESDI
ncbi:conserved exported hypothetical protein [Vibrio chagasii]|jgi:hypothetical protein|uniref:hypothetical protein n=1 Tax=Vibrio TaxID=662 RepID=UPI000CF4F946|nr:MULTISPECIES: hypothetical protein [Vibrio]MCG9560339.1 hypothetical protein [Vibrio chagasii]MCG9564916.1 hypothetical protein [Vibrio chagasii]NOI37866.1 hypothetical protein [Vibrio sp. 070316B]NOI93494.1 hypothetical protein [Vibrio sp. T3Y01]PQJ51387.1 hypothetical protein BTO12_15820 [Vibrio splendidus]